MRAGLRPMFEGLHGVTVRLSSESRRGSVKRLAAFQVIQEGLKSDSGPSKNGRPPEHVGVRVMMSFAAIFHHPKHSNYVHPQN